MIPDALTLGILAGGRATRLDGADKAWLVREGVPQVQRWQRRFARETGAVLVSANRSLERYADAGLTALPDRIDGDVGPLAGLDTLAEATRTEWLLTVPVDLVGVNECLVQTLVACADADGAYAQDEDGLQPLVALWRVAALRVAICDVLAQNDRSVQAVQRRMQMRCVRFAGVRFGNLNTPADLSAAGAERGDV